MPQSVERRLRRKAQAMGLPKKRQNAYVFGTMRKMGWKPRRHGR